MNLQRAANFFIITISVVFILIVGKGLLIPFVFAMLLWFIVDQVKAKLDLIPFVKKRFPSWLKSIITTIALLSAISFITGVLSSSIANLIERYPEYESNVAVIVGRLDQLLGIDIENLLLEQLDSANFTGLLATIFNSLTSLLGNTFIVLIYALFIFLEEGKFGLKLKKAFQIRSSYKDLLEIIFQIKASVARYLGLKTFVSLITGILSFIVLLIIGVDSAAFWAFLIFLLNYIPTVGSLIATLFPSLFALLQFGEFGPFFLVLILVGATQVIIGNILEPKLMGDSMNLSPLVAILGLTIWGAIWGITGMVLSIPITVTMIIVFSHFPSTQPIAILLSEEGDISIKDD